MLRACACSARNSAVVKLPEEPSPVPAGISASVVISIWRGLAGKQPQRLADDAVLDLVDRIDVLDLGIFQIDAGLERLDHADIDVFVDRRRDQKSLMLAVIGGEIGAAAAEADAQGRSHDDHGCARS